MSPEEFLSQYISNAPRLMWFLGAGASRAAKLPTAIDLIEKLKVLLYCRKTGQDIDQYRILHDGVREKINSYFSSMSGFPKPNSKEEYSFYFEQIFGTDKLTQQQYLKDALKFENLSTGHKILGTLLALSQARIVFTTNFDEVVESAYAYITGKALHPYHIEGASAALNALNSEEYPLYVKLHGDYRYTSIKNLSADLKTNDEQLQTCLINACSRYGMVVSGYSGRDENIMRCFYAALESKNAFPAGFFWITRRQIDLFEDVKKFIDKAKACGVNAHIIEGVDTFDILMMRIWQLLPCKPPEYAQKIRPLINSTTFPPLAIPSGKNFPVIRFNAIEITSLPTSCLSTDIPEIRTYKELREKCKLAKPNLITTKTEKVLFWGAENELSKLSSGKCNIAAHDLVSEVNNLGQNYIVKNFITEALCRSLTKDKPIYIKRRKTGFFIVVNPAAVTHSIFQELKQVAQRDLIGRGSGFEWSEAVEVKVEQKNSKHYLIIVPTIWIQPPESREVAKFFLRAELKKRANQKYNAYLNAWLHIFFTSQVVSNKQPISVTAYSAITGNNPAFTIIPQTCFAGKL